MSTVLGTINGPVGIRQTIKAGSQFTGVAPSDAGSPLTPTLNIDLFSFAPGNAGGLFNVGATYYSFESRSPFELLGVNLTLADQASWKVELADVDGNLVTLYSGTNQPSYVAKITDSVVILYGSQLKLTTVGASLAMTATMIIAPYRWERLR